MAIENIQVLRASIQKRKIWDYVFVVLAIFSLFFGFAILLALVAQLFIQGGAKLSWEFLSSPPDPRPEDAGILVAMVGTATIMLVTIVLAVPIGIASGVYLQEYAKKGWLSDIIEVNVSNLAGVPSIVYGLLALGIFKQQLQLGESIITAALTLSLLILPVIIVTTREALKSIPQSLREGAYGIGTSRWQMIWDHVLPAAAGGVLTGIIVALSRAIGEAAPLITIGALTFITSLPDSPITGEFPYFSFSWLLSDFTVLPIQMFDWVSRPQPAFQLNAGAAGVVLVILTIIMNGSAIYLRVFFRNRIKW
ncbi:MAG: phosphate ABC transporter permease PstA [Pseudanabaenaceae cyanobacterium bins.68]|nr:phosphate ABC transporter permease PstA [Pseudanabaenaceae cyanobacterium bins.68]